MSNDPLARLSTASAEVIDRIGDCIRQALVQTAAMSDGSPGQGEAIADSPLAPACREALQKVEQLCRSCRDSQEHAGQAIEQLDAQLQASEQSLRTWLEQTATIRRTLASWAGSPLR